MAGRWDWNSFWISRWWSVGRLVEILWLKTILALIFFNYRSQLEDEWFVQSSWYSTNLRYTCCKAEENRRIEPRTSTLLSLTPLNFLDVHNNQDALQATVLPDMTVFPKKYTKDHAFWEKYSNFQIWPLTTVSQGSYLVRDLFHFFHRNLPLCFSP